MAITKQEVAYVANLARLDLDDESLEKFAVQIDNILEYIEILDSVDTKGVPPTSHAISMTNVFREDTSPENFEREKALSNAPEKDKENFLVPKVVG
jgi:aspartyl-tRNA(Asn)/glutamyl-tRNA(Gln) amidotransferase subunit C